MAEFLKIILIPFPTLFLSIFFFLMMRDQLVRIIMYVIGKKEYKTDRKQHSFIERITLRKYDIILPKWTRVLYRIQMISSITMIVVFVLGEVFGNLFLLFVLYAVSLSVTASVPLVVYLRTLNFAGTSSNLNHEPGGIQNYAKIVDKYAIRRKLYPELYQDEDDNQGTVL